MRTYTHPHPKPEHVMRHYRKFVLGEKRAMNGMARKAPVGCFRANGCTEHPEGGCPQPASGRAHRGIIKYRAIVEEYLAAKAHHIGHKPHELEVCPDCEGEPLFPNGAICLCCTGEIMIRLYRPGCLCEGCVNRRAQL